MKLHRVLLALLILTACGPDERRGVQEDAAVVVFEDAPVAQDICTQQGKPPTTLSGTVYAPNGTLQVYGVNVYIPETDPGPLSVGLECSKCVDELPGGSLARTTSGNFGEFTLTGVPTGVNIPLVIQVGRWRRQIVIPEIKECGVICRTPAGRRGPGRSPKRTCRRSRS